MRWRALTALILAGPPLGSCCSGAGSDPISGALCLASAPVLLAEYAIRASTSDSDTLRVHNDWLEELRVKAEQGDTDAQLRLANIANDGTERWKWICLAANQSAPLAQRQVAYWYRDVDDRYWSTPIQHPDNINAYMWYALAAANGDEGSAISRGDLRETMTQDQISEAERLVAEWKADPNSCETTTLSPGYNLETVRQHPKSHDNEAHLEKFYALTGDERYKWLCLSANGGNLNAQNVLGRHFWYAIGPYDKNHVAAYMWFRISANQGFEDSKIDLANLGPGLTPIQHDQVSRPVAEWKPDSNSCDTPASPGS